MKSIRTRYSILVSVVLAAVWGCNDATTGDASNEARTVLGGRVDNVSAQIDALKASGDGQRAIELQLALEKMLTDIELQLSPDTKHGELQQDAFLADIAETRRRIAELPDDDSSVTAVEFSDRLTRLESAMKSGSLDRTFEETIPGPDLPFVQWLHFQNTSTDAGAASFDAVWDLASRPAVLVLSSNRAVDWKLAANTASQLQAVILLGETDTFQSADDVLVFRRIRPIRELDSVTREIVSNFIADQAGARPTSVMQVHRANVPITLGTTSKDWVRAYVVGELASLRADVQEQINDAFLSDHGNIRFNSVMTVQQSQSRSRSLAEYTLQGPIVESQQPLGGSYWNYQQTKNGTEYSLSRHGPRVRKGSRPNRVGEAGGATHDMQWVGLNTPATLQKTTHSRALSYDATRDRLVVLDHEGTLHAMDCESGEWSIIGKVPGAIALMWTPQDELVTLTQTPKNADETRFHTSITFLDYRGKKLRELTTTCTARLQGRYESAANELCMSQGFLLAVQPASGVVHFYPTRATIRAFDLANGKMGYEYDVPPLHTSVIQPTRDWAKYGDSTRYVVYRERLRAAQRSVDRVHGRQIPGSASFEKQIERLSDPVAYVRSNEESPSVHWVRLTTSRSPLIRVTDTSAPVILAITAFEVSECRVQIADGVDVRKVIVTCDESVPAIRGFRDNGENGDAEFDDVELIVHSKKDVRPQDLAVYRQPSYLKAVIEEIAGHPVSTEINTQLSGARSATVTIGPDDGDWVVQQVLKGLDRVILEADRSAPRKALPEDFRFAYPFRGHLPGGNTSSRIVDCSFRGPILNTGFDAGPFHTMVTKSGDDSYVTFAPETGFLRLRATADGFESPVPSVALMNDDFMPLQPTCKGFQVSPIEAGPTNYVQGLMYDAANDRLLCLAGQELHTHDSDGWKKRQMPAISAEAWCFGNSQRIFHAIIRNGQQLTEMHEISASGAVLRQRVLPVPIPCLFHGVHNRCSMFCADQQASEGHLVVVLRRHNAGDSNTDRVYVLDLSDLAIVHQGGFAPSLRYEPVDEKMFEKLWARLDAQDNTAAEAAMWRLATGFADTSSRMERRLGMKSMPTSEVNRHIAQLDADTFAERDAAYNALAESATVVREKLADVPFTSEVQRLYLLRLLDQGSQTQRLRATTVLEWMKKYGGR